MNTNNQPESNLNNNTSAGMTTNNNAGMTTNNNSGMTTNNNSGMAVNNNAGMTMNTNEDEKKIYTNADLVRLLKLSKLVNKNENNLQNPPHPSIQQSPQIIPIQQAPIQMMPYPQQPTMMYQPQQPMMYPPQPQPQPQQTQGNLNFIDREEIRSMISRYSEDTETLLKNYVKANNEKMIKYVKEMLEYKQTMNSLVRAAEAENQTEENNTTEESNQNNTAAPIINAINSIPKQLGSVFKSVSGAVGNVVNSANQTILGKKPENTNTNTNTTTTPENSNNEKQIDNQLKENTTMTNTNTKPISNLNEPTFEPVSDETIKNEKDKLAQEEVKKVNSEISNLFGTNAQKTPSSRQNNQKGGGKIRKISRKKNMNTKSNANKNKRSHVRVKK
jgi:hypothetical protein